MNKVILIDDRPKRMSLALEKTGNDLNIYNSINGLEIPMDEHCNAIKDELNSGSGKLILNFSLIIAHQSALNGIGLNTLDSTCKLQNIKLILFSGSIRQPVYTNDNGFEKLIVNSKDLYSAGLLPFIKKTLNNQLEHLTELVYAEKWKLGIALTYRQLLIDKKYGDDINLIYHKKKQLLNCVSILGERTLEDLSKLINDQIDNS
jgi:hypothetical protein